MRAQGSWRHQELYELGIPKWRLREVEGTSDDNLGTRRLQRIGYKV